MSVNLNNLNISLDNFNAAANGTYNIGQMKLNKDGTGVYRANSHKTWTILNKTEISQEEALAVKEAFCRAVKNEAKLDESAVNELKEKLGIGSSKYSSMKAGQMKALTAAEVREVIDTYADKINKNRADGAQLRTSADFYKGVSQKKLASRAEAREKINAQTLEKFAPTEADKALNSIMELMEYDGGNSISEETKMLAKSFVKHGQRAIPEDKHFMPYKDAPVKFGLREDKTLYAVVKLTTGSELSIDLGLTQKQMLDKLLPMMDSFAVDDMAKGIKMETVEVKPKVFDPLALSKPKVDALKKEVLENIKKTFNKIETIGDDTNALREFRGGDSGLMEKLSKHLNLTLVAVRGHDPRNAQLVNKFREAFYLDPQNPVDKDELFDQISEVLNKERTSLQDNVDKDIEELGATDAGKKLQQQLNDDDDDLPALNINQLTGTTDQDGNFVDKF